MQRTLSEQELHAIDAYLRATAKTCLKCAIGSGAGSGGRTRTVPVASGVEGA